jgi:hypothetical protein
MINKQNLNQPDMTAVTKNENPGIHKLLSCKCPRCRKGDMFVDKNPWNLKNTMKMYKGCSVCGQHFNMEVGFYFGSGYVSYALSVAISVATFVAWFVLIMTATN